MKANKSLKINRLWDELANPTNPTRLESGIELSLLLMKQQQVDDAISVGLAVVDQAEDLYVGVLADHVANVALCLHENQRSQEALDLLSETVARGRREDNIEGILPCLVVRGRIEQDLGQPIAALASWQEAALLADWIDDYSLAGPLHIDVARLADDYWDFAEAFKAASKAIDGYRKDHNFKGVCKSMHFAGQLSLGNDHFAAAESYATSALELAEFLGKPTYIARCLILLGQALSKQGKHSDAIATLQRATKLTDNKKTRQLALEAFGHLADAYEAAGDIEMGKKARSTHKTLTARN